MKRSRSRLVWPAVVLVLGLSAPWTASSSNNGIMALMAVVQQKVQQANQEALSAASRQRSLVQRQKDGRERALLDEQARQSEAYARQFEALSKDLKEIQRRLKEAGCE
jgi:hypothetical protein